MGLLDPLQSAPEPEALRESWRLLELPAPWIVVLVLIPAVLAVAAGAYWKENLPSPSRVAMVGLRVLSFSLLLVVLFRPVKVTQHELVEAPKVVVIVDDSASMRRMDTYTGDETARAALRELAGRAPETVSRLELATDALQATLLPHLAQRGYDARLFRFDERLTDLTGLDALAGRGRGTHLGDAIGQVLARHRGRHVTDVVVVSDGRQNGGVDVLDAAAGARAAGIPVHTVVVGDTRPERNLAVELVEAPPGVLEGDEVALSVRVNARGSDVQGSTQVLLEELDPDGREDPRTVASETIDLADAGDRVVLIAPPGTSALDATQRRFRVTVQELPDERMLDDNVLELSVHLVREKIRVLYVDGYPRWEYRFLKDLLLRSDDRIDVQVYLMSATPDFPQEATSGIGRLTRVPSDRRELLDGYDVILLGDVNPYAISPDPALGDEFVESLFEFVEQGGGLGVIAGEWANPKAVAGTEFAKLLPVVLEGSGSLVLDVSTEIEYRPLLESPTNPHEIVRLHPDLELNRELWEEPTGLHGFYWHYPVVAAKPGTQVLLRHPQRRPTGGEERDPLLVVGYYPAGRTLFLATDDQTWRWRFRYVNRYHERFWRNAVRWLALGRLKDGDRRFGLEPLRTRYGLDERVTLEARVLDEDYQPQDAESQEAYLQGPEGPPEPFSLVRVEGRPGVYRGTFLAERPGFYRAWIEVDGAHVASSEFEVVLPSRENANPSPDPEAMAAVARLSGGRAVSVSDAASLLVEFPGGEERREPISSQLQDAWDNWSTLLLALGLLSVEWILRKRHDLI